MEDISEKEEVGSKAIYEIGYHILPTIDEQNVPSIVSSLKEEVEKAGGVFVMEEFPTRISLAYPMSKVVDGKRTRFDGAYFGWMKFELLRENIESLKKAFDDHKDILRFLLIETVREDTRAPKRVTAPPKQELPKPKPISSLTKKETPAPVSEDELDRTIEKLVAE